MSLHADFLLFDFDPFLILRPDNHLRVTIYTDINAYKYLMNLNTNFLQCSKAKI